MLYPQELRETAVRRILAKETTSAQFARDNDVNVSTVYNWIYCARRQAIHGKDSVPVSNQQNKLKLPKGKHVQDAYAAVILMRHLPETDFGQYCRANGLLVEQVREWDKWFQANPELAFGHELKQERQARVQEEKARKAAERSENRKDKALAEMSALLVLTKKAQAIWGDKGN